MYGNEITIIREKNLGINMRSNLKSIRQRLSSQNTRHNIEYVALLKQHPKYVFRSPDFVKADIYRRRRGNKQELSNSHQNSEMKLMKKN